MSQSGFERGSDGEEGVDAGCVEQLRDARGGRDEYEAGTVALTAGVEVDDFAEAGGVHVRNAVEIEDGEKLVVLAEFGAEGVQIADDERAVEMEDAAARFGDG